MAILGSPNYRVGLIIAKAQPFHDGHLKIITDALMTCDEIIFCLRDMDTAYFNYNIMQKSYRELNDLNFRVAFFGINSDPLLGTPKQIIQRVLDKLEEGRYNMPTHFFTTYDTWIDSAKELQLTTVRVSTLVEHDSNVILQSILNGTNDWKDKVPYALIETLETYIATKNRNF